MRTIADVHLTGKRFWRTDYLKILLPRTREDPQARRLTVDARVDDIFEIRGDMTRVGLQAMTLAPTRGIGERLTQAISGKNADLFRRFLIVSNVEIQADEGISGGYCFQLLQLVNEWHRIPLVVDG
jgi:hypothetical protein